VSLDPTSVTKPILALIHSTIAISGTISPLDAYSEMLGFEPDASKVIFSNPFAQKNRLGIIVDGLDTSYERRSAKMFKQMVEYCVAVAHATPNNTGIFTTSYGIAKSLLKAGLGKKLQKKMYLEEQGMSTRDNDTMIENFKKEGMKGGAVLLGVQGGRNSEGGDFPGPMMEAVIVVGVPYARPTPRNKALIEYFNKRFNGKGRDYAYVLPAMTRAIQAAGRPVRRMDDKGAIILLDQRFSTPYLKRFMPAWLTNVIQTMSGGPDLVAEHIEMFFSS
jgi:DNA excision repair protein ERCC-2